MRLTDRERAAELHEAATAASEKVTLAYLRDQGITDVQSWLQDNGNRFQVSDDELMKPLGDNAQREYLTLEALCRANDLIAIYDLIWRVEKSNLIYCAITRNDVPLREQSYTFQEALSNGHSDVYRWMEECRIPTEICKCLEERFIAQMTSAAGVTLEDADRILQILPGINGALAQSLGLTLPDRD